MGEMEAAGAEQGMCGFYLAVAKLYFQKKDLSDTKGLLWLLMKNYRPVERGPCHYHEHDELCGPCVDARGGGKEGGWNRVGG